LIKYLQTFHIRLTVRRDIYENANQKAEIVVTPTSYWAKIDGMGIAAVNSLTYNIPAFVFSDVSNNNIRNTALAIAHEVGHIVGLNHTKTNNSFYNSSFMGYPYLSSNPIWTEEDKQIINQNLQ
jgi:Zn-dependent peptidase ImmA (M78 family)